MLLLAVFVLGFYMALGGVLFKSLAAGLAGTGLMLGSAAILFLPPPADPEQSK
jgi:hypothetical protein